MKFLLELQVENIPANNLDDILQQLNIISKDVLTDHNISFSSLEINGTYRRIVLLVNDLHYPMGDSKEELVGPPQAIAYKDGELSKAGIAFINNNHITEQDLFIKEKDGKQYIAGTITKKAISQEELFSSIVEKIIKGFQFKKSMNWNGIEFIRPIRNILVLLDNQPIAIKLGELTANNNLWGESINNIEQYFEVINDKIILSKSKRLEIIQQSIEAESKMVEYGSNSTEHPKVVTVSFDYNFLTLPEIIITSTIEEHQNGVPIFIDGNITNQFYIVTESYVDDKNISRGNSQVVNSKLSDAKFFFEEDIKISIEEHASYLNKILFQKELGNMEEKSLRLKAVGQHIGKELNFNLEIIGRAAQLAKADLNTLIIKEKEYTSLKGSIGWVYATKSGESLEIASAIEEHYLPKFQGDRLPFTNEGIALAIAEKIDNITGPAISKGLPSGAKDPFFVRREAIGLIKILLGKKIHMKLDNLFEQSYKEYEKQNHTKKSWDESQKDFIHFFKNRLEGVLQDHFSKEVSNSVIDHWKDPYDAFLRAEAISNLVDQQQFSQLVEVSKRVKNILKDRVTASIDEKLLIEKEEIDLYQELQTIDENESYKIILNQISNLSCKLESFFDRVIVMHEDEAIKKNRIALLGKVNKKVNIVGEISRIYN